MTWQTSSKVLKDVISLLEEGTSGTGESQKEFEKDYLSMTWELSVAEDGSYWLNA